MSSYYMCVVIFLEHYFIVLFSVLLVFILSLMLMLTYHIPYIFSIYSEIYNFNTKNKE